MDIFIWMLIHRGLGDQMVNVSGSVVPSADVTQMDAELLIHRGMSVGLADQKVDISSSWRSADDDDHK